MENKGVEGLTAVRHDGRLFLLGLGEPRFEAVEGVAFLVTNQVVVATDRRNPGRHPDTEQSVAVFDLP